MEKAGASNGNRRRGIEVESEDERRAGRDERERARRDDEGDLDRDSPGRSG
jgi:hypothetical protein